MRIKSVEKAFSWKDTYVSLEEATGLGRLFLIYARKTRVDLSDYWFRIAKNWNLNIWIEGEDQGLIRASVYPVDVDGTTDYDISYRIYTQEDEHDSN